MMVLTAKVDMKKILLILASAAIVILFLVLFFGGGKDAQTTMSAQATPTNDGRVKFLKDFGWDVNNSPKESSQVRIPEESNEVFDRYNALQKGQGYDLSEYAGKKVMRYVYQVNNYPGATDPVYATLLVYKNRIIGGDVTNTGAKGKISGFKMPAPAEATQPTLPETTVPTEETTAPVTANEKM